MTLKPPKTAFILAAGYGTRLEPLTLIRPKPLVPLWNRPMLRHTMNLLKSWGVEQLIINTHHKAELLNTFCHEQSDFEIELIHEKEILGTGGALQHARHLLPDTPFWLVNADIAIDLSPAPLLTLFEQHAPLAALWMHDSKGPRTVEVQNQHVTSFRSTQCGGSGTFTFTGLHLVSNDICDYLPRKGFSSVIAGYEKALDAGRTILGTAVPDSFWADIGNPAQYIQAHKDIEAAAANHAPGSRLYDPTNKKRVEQQLHETSNQHNLLVLGHGNTIGDHVTLSDTVLWNHCTIPDTALLHNAIIADHSVFSPKMCGKDCLYTPNDVLTRQEKLITDPWFGQNTYSIEALPLRGSNRRFFRIATPQKSCILIRYDSQARPENAIYADHMNWLHECGFPTPEVICHDAKHSFLFMEDAGFTDLGNLVSHSQPINIVERYKQVLDALVLLETLCTESEKSDPLPLQPAFDAELYEWEHKLFINEFITGRITLSSSDLEELMNELSSISALLMQQPTVLVHRDMQSSNVLIHHDSISIIDCQGMRRGAAAYDIASLLCDPYVNLDRSLQQKLLAYYNAQYPQHPITDTIFNAAAIQRLLQALGAYGRLSKHPATARFSAFIPPALGLVKQSLRHFPKLTKLEQLTQSLDRC